MRKILVLVIIFSFMCFEGVYAADESPADWTNNKFIAHAMGAAMNGETYTNSYEAFILNYAQGQRVFEVDLSLTLDNTLVARHDWSEFFNAYLQLQVPENRGEGPWTREEFMSQKIMKKYTPLDIKKIVELLRAYPDMYIVTDTKETESDLVRKQFQIIVSETKGDSDILYRIIPQIYNQGMLEDVKSTYDFPNIIYTLYMSPDTNDQVIEFAKQQNIRVVTLPITRANSKFLGDLASNGIASYVHTINSLVEVSNYEASGVHGFYTDAITQKIFDFSRTLNDLQKKILGIVAN